MQNLSSSCASLASWTSVLSLKVVDALIKKGDLFTCAGGVVVLC